MYRGKAIENEAAIVQRLQQYYGTAVVCSDSIHDQADSVMAERMESGSSVTRIPEISSEILQNKTINRDIIRSVAEFCEKKGIDPSALTDSQIEEIIHKEVRRRLLSAVNDDNASGRYRKLPIDCTKRVWNSGYNWDGESLLLPEEFAKIDQSDPNEPRPTPKKTRKSRKSSPQVKVTSVEPAQGGVDVALVGLSNEPLGIVHIEGDDEEREVTVLGKIDTTAIDLAVSEALLRAGYTGSQQYNIVQTVTRTVTIDRGPGVDAVRKALQGSPEGGDDDWDAAVETDTDEPTTAKYTVGNVEMDPPDDNSEKDPEDCI